MGRSSAPWRPTEPFDYLWMHHNASALGPWTNDDWSAAVAKLPVSGTRSRAGLIYLQVNLWSPWVRMLAQSAHANRAGVTVYFVGPRLPFDLGVACPGCGWLPLDDAGIHRQLATLGLRLSGRATDLLISSRPHTATRKASIERLLSAD
mmetsp:Transcript_22881/g.58185  ORF Transcript_22881/g.58185 Transcript_22881/m.58185 type:complete len:149 (-) Transcript_22881:463-909(-)